MSIDPRRSGDRRPHVVVIGGGIAGLSAALALLEEDSRRPRVTVLDGAPVVGGKLRVSTIAGIPVDEGAESMLAARPEAVALARAVGLGDRIVAPTTTTAALWSRARLRPLPTGLVMGVPTDLRALAAADVLAWPSLLRLPLDHLLPPTPIEDDLAVGAYVRARLGPEVVDRLIEPLLGGVYAGRAEALSLAATMPALFRAVRTERSLLAAARQVAATGAAGAGARRGPVFVGIAGGVGSLAQAVAAEVSSRGGLVRTRAMARELRRVPGGWRITVGPARAAEVLDADAVIVAVPAAPAARLLADEVPAAATDLAGIETASVAVVTLAYRSGDVPATRSGSGFLVPPVERRAVKAATYASDKWSWLADAAAEQPTPLALLRASLGRHGEEEVLQRDDDDLAALAHADLSAALGLAGRPVAVRVTRWGAALPQYAVGHVARVERIRRAVAAAPGLAVCGASYDGVGIAACAGSARVAAAEVQAWLAGPRGEARSGPENRTGNGPENRTGSGAAGETGGDTGQWRHG